DEILAREGYKRKLNNLPSVKNDLQLWKNYYLSEVLMNSYADSIKITDDEVQGFISKEQNSFNNSLQVNILEILTDNIESVENILNELNEGKDFKALASVYNKREWTKQSKGEWGFFNSNMGGEIGKIAAGLEIDQIYGPLKVPEGFSIFKLIDKKEIKIQKQIITDKDSLKVIKVKLALSKIDNLINDKTVLLAKKYRITLNEQLLKTVEISEQNTFTYRFIGFGGKIAAFPITIPMYEWFKQYEQNKEIP
ncbi:MAG: peptidylprolyl isomerase, partial [Ignavibacteria bacterium]|nr:peptidylprolyl isomerase [Ignavibacteria bacterium]